MGQSGPGSNGNEGELHIPQTPRTRASLSDAVWSHTQDTCERFLGANLLIGDTIYKWNQAEYQINSLIFNPPYQLMKFWPSFNLNFQDEMFLLLYTDFFKTSFLIFVFVTIHQPLYPLVLYLLLEDEILLLLYTDFFKTSFLIFVFVTIHQPLYPLVLYLLLEDEILLLLYTDFFKTSFLIFVFVTIHQPLYPLVLYLLLGDEILLLLYIDFF